MSAYQQQYWRELVQLKFEAEYLRELIARDESIRRRIDVVLAVTSSAGIGGWAIWSEVGFLWASGIAASHVIGAVRHLFPIGERLRKLPAFRSEIESVLLFAERHWFDVAEGAVDERQIHELRLELKERRAAAAHRSVGDLTLPRIAALAERAEATTDDYFETHYVERR